MNYKVIAKNNIKNGFGLYQNYFISLSLILGLFNTLQIFAKDHVIADSLSSSAKVEFMSYVTSILFTLFTIFFIIYFNHFFLKQRAEELGIYSMLGMSKKNITSILMIENTIIIGMACFAGIFLSILFYSLIKILLIAALKLDIPYLTQFTFLPFLITIALSIFILLVIFFDNHHLIKCLSIINISNLNQAGEKAVKTKSWTAYLGIISLLIGYVLVLDLVKQQSLWVKIGFVPMALITLVLVIIGTFLIIKSTLAYLINRKINNHHQLYRPTNNIFLPESLFKLKTKSNLLVVLSLVISAVIALTATCFLLINYQKASLIKTVPSAIEIDQKLKPDQVTKVKQITKNYGGDFKTVKVINATAKRPIVLSEKMATKKCRIINLSTFKGLLKQQYNKPQHNSKFSKKLAYLFTPYTIKNSRGTVNINKQKVSLKETNIWPIFAKGNFAYIAVNDQQFKKISQHANSKTIYAINGANLRDNEELYNKIKELKLQFLSAYKTNKDALSYNSAAFLMATFISVLFFVFIGCILYFTILMDTLGVTDEFKFLGDIGYNKKQLRKAATANNLLIFLPPIIMGGLNGLMAFIGFRFNFLANDVIKFLGAFQMVGEPIIITCLLLLIAYSIIYFFSYHKTKVLLGI
ncbi:ABC transporter permease [Lactobacillus sp. ESL0236]|uniref:FtsX-like permease family protein n=1 Tax=unclassified Lactobacillus TaxID=2620435 RepID=UPI000EFB6952|nr:MULTISPECIES: ABC transporter permease [unclassified Lactobacillus]RMC38727.1 ABC transporter permease [Lactobacillus sp. ESL0237]RMC43072.1 ABC transporter permease [Lactobacillus sp. ESL0234]RMC43926.1 ABC transporter permease [Lactobacillus sp. ESL0236]